MWRLVLLLPHLAFGQVLYDAYFGRPVTDERNNIFNALNITESCTTRVEPCRKYEGRRLDGTCVNPKYPSRNGSPTPLLRMLPARFGLGNSLRHAMNGSVLPSARLIRTKILSEGFAEDHNFNTLATYLFVFSIADSMDLTVQQQYAVESDCCLSNNPDLVSPKCIPIPVPEDDPYLGRTGIRCMTFTRFNTYQDLGCIPPSLPAERYTLPTPLQDLSIVYGYTTNRERQIRTYQGGLLRSEFINGLERPPGTALNCANNTPMENACYEFGDSVNGNTMPANYLTGTWFYREHNRLARRLSHINPCWDDQKLFETARHINIAQWQYLLYYELMAEILGRRNALAAGIIYETDGHVNDFDERYKPGVYHEYLVGTRWIRTLQHGRYDLYNRSGDYLGTRPSVDYEARSGILELNNNESDLTQGAIRQPAAKIDYIIDPDLVERVVGEMRASDIGATDIMRGRDEGLPSYNEYRKICGLPVAHKFSDLKDTINSDKVEQLRRLYDDEVDDVELMVAIFSEKLIEGGWVGPTLFCIMERNLVQWRKSDRFFFEQGDMHASLTLPQLKEVRSTSVARLLCDNGDRVEMMQPRALLNVGKGNEMVSCKKIPGIDLTKWHDSKCQYHDDKEAHNDVWHSGGDWPVYHHEP